MPMLRLHWIYTHLLFDSRLNKPDKQEEPQLPWLLFSLTPAFSRSISKISWWIMMSWDLRFLGHPELAPCEISVMESGRGLIFVSNSAIALCQRISDVTYYELCNQMCYISSSSARSSCQQFYQQLDRLIGWALHIGSKTDFMLIWHSLEAMESTETVGYCWIL